MATITPASVVEFAKELSQEQIVFYSAVLGVFVCKMHAFRYLKSLMIPMGITIIVVRMVSPTGQPSFLELVIEHVKSHGSPLLVHTFQDIIGLLLIVKIVTLISKLLSLDFTSTKKDIMTWGFNQVRGLSVVQSILNKEQAKFEEDFDKELKVKSRAIGDMITVLPKKGTPPEAILQLMRDATVVEDVKWETGHISGAVYNGQRKHIELLNEAFSMYSIANPLHPDVWPSVMKFDSEVIAMTASLVNGGNQNICGTSSSVRTLTFAYFFLLFFCHQSTAYHLNTLTCLLFCVYFLSRAPAPVPLHLHLSTGRH
jgi:hypothetical protein